MLSAHDYWKLWCICYVNPVTYVTLDINPSVELYALINFNLVLKVRGLNSDNVIVGSGKEYRHTKLEKAFNMLFISAKI